MNQERHTPIQRSLLRLLLIATLGGMMLTGGIIAGCSATHREKAQTQANENSAAFGQQQQQIINGTEDTALPAVGALVIDDFAFCTATLIAKRILATAAHCIEAAIDYGQNRIAFRIDLPQSDGSIQSKQFDIAKMFMHPSYSRTRTKDFSDYDVGVLILKQFITETPAIPPYLKPTPQSWIGQDVKVMGYGVIRTYPNEIDSEEKRSISLPLHSIANRHLIHFDQATSRAKRKSACHGDSGGPILKQVGGKWHLIAVNSAAYKSTPSPNGSTYCDGGTLGTRLDANYKDFLASLLTSYGDASLPCQGTQCGDCELCQNNACTPKIISQETYRCKPCQKDSDCGSGGICLRLGKVFRCVQPCDGKGCCPKAHDCQPRRGLSGKNQPVCLPKDPCPKATCSSDADCSNTERCNKGNCELKPPSVHPMICRRCKTSTDCGQGNLCINATSGLGYCVQSCWEGDVCPDGFKCKQVMPGRKQCMPEQLCQAVCSAQNPCPGGYQCKGGKCDHPSGGQLGDFCDSKNQCDPKHDTHTIKAHNTTVYSIAYSPSGTSFATGSSDRTIKLWDTKTRQQQKTFSGHQGAIFAIAYSPDGKTLASGSADRTIKLWDVASGTLKQTLSGHTGAIRALRWHDNTLISGAADNTIKLWTGPTNYVFTRTIAGHTGTVYSIALFISRTTSRIAYIISGSADSTIKYWTTAGRLIRTLKGHKATVRSLAINNTGILLASGSDDKTVRGWYALSGKPYRRTLTGHTGAVNQVLFSPNNENIIAGSADHSIRMWRGYDSALLRVIRNSSVAIHSMALAPDQNMMAIGKADGSVVLLGCFDCGYQCVLSDQVNYYKRCLLACKPPPQPDGKLGGRCIDGKTCDPGLLCYRSFVVGKNICVEACSASNTQCKFGGVCRRIYGTGNDQCRCTFNSDCPKGQICSTTELGKLQGTGLCQPAPKCPQNTVCKSLYQKPFGQFCVPSSPEQPVGAACSLIGKCEPSRSTCLVVRYGQRTELCGESCKKTNKQCQFGGTCQQGDAVCYCTKDEDCVKNRKCRPVYKDANGQTKGICAVPDDTPCISNGDCVVGYSCFSGKCYFGDKPPPEPTAEPTAEPQAEPTPEPDAGSTPEPTPEPVAEPNSPDELDDAGGADEPTTTPEKATEKPVTDPGIVDNAPKTGCQGCHSGQRTPPIGAFWVLCLFGLGTWQRRREKARQNIA